MVHLLFSLLSESNSAAKVRRQIESIHSHGTGGMAAMGAKAGPDSIMPNIPPSLMSSLGSLATGFLTSQKAMKIEKIQPLLREGATRIKITYGPYKLKGLKV
jgi:hypothetical protein